ncbi:TRF2-interacting telomeric protein/Rap1 C terminal domain-containing protein [Rostrohypoxylon terebratum]|nr:TRF2-interacting telomeric protein/Rap1 C terminal domain-containing protein [Rostrohypoxylon terebratum]
MSAPIVYEGALAPNNPPLNRLFKNMKIWVAQRIPTRLHYVQIIQNNGGTVVPLEKTADILIADHLKKNSCPPDSYSYKWIEDSVKAGTLQPRENYSCVSASTAVPPKATRVAFTPEDDKILAEWVMKKREEGESLGGLKIYKELAAMHPQHTYQSWQDRWIRQPDPLRSLVSFGEKASHLPSPSRPKTPATPRTPLRSRAKFTAEDDNLLINYVQQCQSENKPTHGNVIFQELANEFPHHTAQSWRDRWVKVLAPRNANGSTRAKPRAGARKTQRSSPPQKTTSNETSTPERSDSGSKGLTQSIPPKAVDELEDEDESLERQSSAGVRTRPEPPPAESSDESMDLDRSSTGSSTNGIASKEEFRRYYGLFVEEQEGRIPTPFLTIKGITFEPWDLWEAVASQKMVPEERDWQQIAEKLGFDWVQHETVHDELRDCYNQHLALFEDFWNNLQEEVEEDKDEERENQDSDKPLPSSPPAIPSSKRPLDTHRLSSDHAYPQSSPKRRKLNDDEEIASTPDHINGTSNLRRPAAAETTPTTRRSTGGLVDDRNEEDESRDTLNELPAIKRRRKKGLEPETQDFRFDPETQAIVFDTQARGETESQFSITPSQQLHQESDAVSPDIANASPTPKAKTKKSIKGTPTPKRTIRNPFQGDSEEETPPPAIDSRTPKATTTTATVSKAKRRSLPESFSPKPSRIASSTPAPTTTQVQSHSPEVPQPTRRAVPVKETPDDVIDRFCSLGYPKNIVLLALRATTWRLGDAGQVMEMLKRGEELPQRTHGVWTQRDDDALKLVMSDDPPKDEKEERKRTRSKKRLEEKHGTELMELRYKYLWGDV